MTDYTNPTERIGAVPDERHRRYLNDATFRRLVDGIATAVESGALKFGDVHDAVQHALVVRAYDDVCDG